MIERREYGDLTWLFGGDNIINMRQVRRFELARKYFPDGNDRLAIYYIDGSVDVLEGDALRGVWKALVKASESANIRV